jgi:sortase A
MRFLRKIESLSLAVGLALLTVYSVGRIDGAIWSRMALLAFHESTADAAIKKEGQHEAVCAVDFSLWSEKRIAAYKSLLVTKFDKPLAVLSIPRLRLEVPVFDGTDDATLNRGAGRISGTARPGESGNVGIAAHRDGFFRGLKDIRVGDQVTLTTPEHSTTYIVDVIDIVTPDNVQVLQPRARPSLTLVTCYPFYFVGDAPRRYIVHASIADLKTTESPRQ